MAERWNLNKMDKTSIFEPPWDSKGSSLIAWETSVFLGVFPYVLYFILMLPYGRRMQTLRLVLETSGLPLLGFLSWKDDRSIFCWSQKPTQEHWGWVVVSLNLGCKLWYLLSYVFFCWDGYFVWHSRSLVMQCFLWRYLNAISTPWGNGKDCLHCHLCPCHLGFYWELKIRQDMQHHSWRWSFFCVEGWFKKGDSKGAIGGLCLYSFSMFGFVMAFPLKLSELGAQTLRFGKCCACLQVSHFLASSFSLCLSCAFLEAQPRAPGDEIKARKKTRQRGAFSELSPTCPANSITFI